MVTNIILDPACCMVASCNIVHYKITSCNKISRAERSAFVMWLSLVHGSPPPPSELGNVSKS